MLKISNKLFLYFILFINIFICGFIFYAFFSYNEIFGCERIYYRIIWLLYLFGVPLLLYFIIKIIYRKPYKPIYFFFAIVGLGLIGINNRNKKIEDIINMDGGRVSLGIVKNKYSYYNDPNNIFVELLEIKSNIYNFHVNDNMYNILKKNDTVTLLYSINCKEWVLPHDFTPSPELIQQCKDGCYYKDGKIVEEL